MSKPIDNFKYRLEEDHAYSDLLMNLDSYAKRITLKDSSKKFIFFIKSDTLSEFESNIDTLNLLTNNLNYRTIDQKNFNQNQRNKLIRDDTFLTLAERQNEFNLYQEFRKSHNNTPNVYEFSRILFNEDFTIGILQYRCHPGCGSCEIIITKQAEKWVISKKLLCVPLF